MDIRFGRKGAAGSLSNFTARPFVFDGVQCASMEGLLQSFKIQDVEKQKQMCLKVGKAAKAAGKKYEWWHNQTMWWNGIPYKRDSVEYQDLLDDAYLSMAEQNPEFVAELLSTGQEALTHSIGKSDPTGTILTEHEFCSRLMNLRANYALDQHIS